MLTLRQLQYFLALAELRHFGKAAERCCVTQPALSMQIKELEGELGTRLIERTRGNIDLTPEGKEIAAHAQAILGRVRDLQNYARLKNRILAGNLSLGVIPSVAPYLMPKVLPTLQARYPDLQLHLHETLTKPLLDQLTEGSLDAIILALPVADAHIETMSLFEDRFLLARQRTSKQARSGNRVLVELDSIRSENLLLLNDGHCLRDQTLSYCTSVDPAMLTEFSASSLSTIVQMVAAGYGVTLLPEIAAKSELTDDRIELQHFIPPEPKRAIGLAWRKTTTREKDFLALAHLIREVQQAGFPGNGHTITAESLVSEPS